MRTCRCLRWWVAWRRPWLRELGGLAAGAAYGGQHDRDPQHLAAAQRAPRTEVVEADKLGGPGVVADREPGRGVARPDGVPHDRPVRVSRPRGALGTGLDGRGVRRGGVAGTAGRSATIVAAATGIISRAEGRTRRAGRWPFLVGPVSGRIRDCVGEVTRAPPSVDGPWWFQPREAP